LAPDNSGRFPVTVLLSREVFFKLKDLAASHRMTQAETVVWAVRSLLLQIQSHPMHPQLFCILASVSLHSAV
jgi:hypothetical protein